ncbi:MAG: hypothetical protein QF426_02550 [Verrucomicrobiales bacterium]|nr:hypothetical protein [Verrucomicrobiales bacterium]
MVTPSQFRPLALLIISMSLVVIFITQKADAQLIVEMKLPKTHYLSYEPMVANVTVYNRAGNDLILGGPKGKGWMTFDVYRDGQLLSPRSIGGKFETMLLKSGRSITKKIDINKLYPVSDYGSYTINASVYFPPQRTYFSSKKIRINVADARAFWKQSFGVSQGRNKLASFRQFSLHEHRGNSSNSALYVRLRETKGTKVYCTFSLGRFINVRKPQATIDSQSRLHVMHMISPRLYSHARVSSEGTFLGNDYYRETADTRPSLVIDSAGIVKVVGGIAYDPNKPPEQKEKPRSASELPPGLISN